MEGLWTVRFLTPDDPTFDLNGGVVVIETRRILGGDSGFFYIGDIGDQNVDRWPVSIVVRRHDPSIISVFGDVDPLYFTGYLIGQTDDCQSRKVMIVKAKTIDGSMNLEAKLTKVSDLP